MSKSTRRVWNYTPTLPLTLAPYWDWPVRPLQGVIYLLKSWNPLASRFFFLACAIVIWNWFTPALEHAQNFSFNWMFEIWLRNLMILTIVAGGLHLLLWRLRVQKDDYRYDLRPMAIGSRRFFFKNQIRDNMLWSYVAVFFWTGFECLIWWASANGWVTFIAFDTHPLWFLLLIILVPIWAGLYFYAHHRLLHVGPFYRHIHSWHHKNINTGPWSGLAMHPVESFILMTDVVIFLIVPAHPIHVLFLMFHHGIGAPTSHAGFDKLRLRRSISIEVGDFYHQLHHKYFDCNYGTCETPWDRWFNTFHDGTRKGDALLKERRKRL